MEQHRSCYFKLYLTCDRSTGTNLYTPAISEDEYKAKASRNFLEKLYNNSIQNMVATLYGNKVIEDSDIAELRNFLDKLEDDQ